MPDLTEFRPFRPRAARVVAWSLIAIVVSGIGGLFAASFLGFLPAWHVGDQILVTAFFAVGVWIMVRLASVAALPDAKGLTVRNFFYARRLEWAEIVRVSMHQGRPWADLDISDGSTLAVMAIQGADGDYGAQEALRLARYVAATEGREGSDGPARPGSGDENRP